MKLIYLLLFGICLIAASLRADDSLYESPNDLSPADKEAAQRLQNVMDADAARAQQIHDHPVTGAEPTEPTAGEAIVFYGILVVMTGGFFVYVFWGIIKAAKG